MKIQSIVALLVCVSVTGCFKSSEEEYENYGKLLVTTDLTYGGEATPEEVYVQPGASTQIAISSMDGYKIAAVTGCEGALHGEIYTTGKIEQNCNVDIQFESSEPTSFVVNAQAFTDGGEVSPAVMVGEMGSVLQFNVVPDEGYVPIVTGCEGTLQGTIYSTAPLATACDIEVTFDKEQSGEYVVDTVTNAEGGQVIPDIMTVIPGAAAQFYLDPGLGFEAVAQGCNGTQVGNIFTTGPIEADCTIEVVFNNITPNSVIITAEAEEGGSIQPEIVAAYLDSVTQFRVVPPPNQQIASATGCDVEINHETNIITTAPITGHCDLYVTFQTDLPEVFIVSAEDVDNGHLSPDKVSVPAGSITQLTARPDSGYTIESIEGCDGYLAGDVYTTGAITEHCVVTPSFVRAGSDSFVVTAEAGEGGNVTPDAVRIQENGQTSFLITPDAGFGIEGASGCDGELSGRVYSTGPITDNCVVEVEFVPVFKVSTSATVGGSISPEMAWVKPGETTEFMLSPDYGYYVENALGCDGTLEGLTYTTGPVTANCEVFARFSEGHFVQTAHSDNGSYHPTWLVLRPNETGYIEIFPNIGWAIDTVYGCGGVLTDDFGPFGRKYRIDGIEEECEVVATFVRF